jgi:invasion protein IalB
MQAEWSSQSATETRTALARGACLAAGLPIAAVPLVAALISDSPAFAAEPSPTPATETQQFLYSPWTKSCGKGNAPDAKEVCFTGKDARTEAGQPVAAAALIEPEGGSRKLFRVTLPSPLQVQYGTRIMMDKEPAISSAFFTCFANGCVADYEATPELVGKLKTGQMLTIVAINVAGKAVSFPLPLVDSLSGNSFAGAYEGPPTDPKVVEAHQRARQWDRLGCTAPPAHFSDCAPDDRKCEVASKMRGCVRDDLPRKKLEYRGPAEQHR